MDTFIRDFDNIEENIKKRLTQYNSVFELAAQLNVNLDCKNGYNTLIIKILEKYDDRLTSQIINNVNFSIKTIRLDKYNKLKESMSLPVFRYTEIVKETWSESKLKNYFIDKTFVFAIFREGKNGYDLCSIQIWKMPLDVLDKHVYQVWQRTIECLKSGKIVKYIDNKGRKISYFPSAADSPCVHVRPHARDNDDTFPLPVADKLTGTLKYPKHSFWLNRSYILKIISEKINI